MCVCQILALVLALGLIELIDLYISYGYHAFSSSSFLCLIRIGISSTGS